jgi:hypothetical protein
VNLSPRAARLRRLQIQHDCQALTETFRQARLDDLDDTWIETCIWCGASNDARVCARCTTHLPESTSQNRVS